MRIRKTWDVHLRARLAGAAGISRPMLARCSSTRSSLRGSRMFESATESLYSQPSMILNPQEQEGKTEDEDSAWEDARSGSASRSASLDTSAPGEGLRDFSGHLARDERGNILVYDSPTIEQMNVGIVVGNTGRMSQQRRSRYASGQAVGHRRRPSEAMLSRGQRLGRAVRESVRVPLGVVKGENELLGPRLKVGESRGKRPVSVENGRRGSQSGVVDERGDLAFL
ncbi:hypothetical protein H2199_004845 [Coniosporium tulheliwenetii]|uniref:Uncharacterized protein n=1 Tax=Coniosporium tulheliwenetii TaxID=3383036 RepID=A0ACC2Z521_9PEZI|nr:hypothetical protein H2199_004845 [Cladosporium sp. JES 115]